MKDFQRILLVILFTIIITDHSNGIENDPCALIPNSVLIADRNSCNGWIRCSNGNSTEGKCPNGLRFNPRLGVCDEAYNVKCYDDLCAEIGNTEDFFADKRLPLNCASYFHCSNGTAIYNKCDDEYWFNYEKQICDHTSNNFYCKDDTNLENHICENVPDGVNVRKIDDCQNYYKCQNGKPILEKCEEPKTYNIKTGECDDGETSNCRIVCSNGVKPKRNPKSCRNYLECDEKNTLAKLVECNQNELVKENSEGVVECVNQMQVDEIVCPNRCEGLEGLTFVPKYETDKYRKCKNYYTCKDGEMLSKQYSSCSKHKLFDVSKQGCVLPSKVDRSTCTTLDV